MSSSDLAELDTLLEDLSNAKKNLANNNQLFSSSNSNSSSLKNKGDFSSESSPANSCSYSPLNSPNPNPHKSETNPEILEIKREDILSR